MLMNFADLSTEQKHQEPTGDHYPIKQEVDDSIPDEQEDVEPPQVVYHLNIQIHK